MNLFTESYLDQILPLIEQIGSLPIEDRVEALNKIRMAIHEVSPFKNEPVDCVVWIPADKVSANDYNPNSVAPPEMRLLEHSITEDGYTQPIVAWTSDGHYEVVDGFHRNRIGKESPTVRKRVHGYLPLTVINSEREDRGDRIAATIRHNRARGKHKVAAMSDIVVELKRRNWTSERICRELGMEEDEVLRLCQITGLADLFKDTEFSQAWDAEGQITEEDFRELTDDPDSFDGEIPDVRTVNTNDETRIFHTYDKWECQKAGFYEPTKEGMTKTECEVAYRDFLADEGKFRDALAHIISEWKHSCEHYLTNRAMNRIAWLGQAAACYAIKIPSAYRSGYYRLTEDQQKHADEVALEYLNRWLVANGRPEVTMEEAYSGDRQSDIY